MKKLLVFYSILSLLITTSLYAVDKGWSVAVDISTNQVVEVVYGDGALSHTGVGYKTAIDLIPSSFMESADKSNLKWVDSNANGTIEAAEIVAMTSGEIATKNTLLVRTGAKSSLDGFTASPLEQRAFASVAVDEINILREQTQGIVGTATVTFDPPNLANGSGATKNDITVTGAAFGDAVDVCAPYSLQGLICTGYVDSANTIGVRVQNQTGAAINLASGSWKVVVRRQGFLSDRTLTQLKTAIKNRIDDGTAD